MLLSHSFWLVGGVFTWEERVNGERAERAAGASPSLGRGRERKPADSIGSQVLLAIHHGLSTTLLLSAQSSSLSPLFFF